METLDLTPHFIKKGPFVFIDKVAGQNTHAPASGQPGLVEMMKIHAGLPLFVASRLDKGTSGAMVFGGDPTAAANLTKLFEKHLVQKTYLFLSHKQHKEKTFEKSSLIFKDGHLPKSDARSNQSNSRTTFEFLKPVGNYFLYQATPHTGKPHQIRLHAEDAGIPVLGDLDHSGAPFYRLCLHSKKIRFLWNDEEYVFESQGPIWTNPLSEKELQIFECLNKRQSLFGEQLKNLSCLRWAHQEIKNFRMDQFGNHLWVYWYHPEDPQDEDFRALETVSHTLGKKMWIREMINRGKQGEISKIWPVSSPDSKWVCFEGDIQYEMRSDQGLSPGLFLDQKHNRSWVKKNAVNKKVLNLFCYTGGFSLAANFGKAAHVTSVDTSQKYLLWAKQNFKLNGFDPESSNLEFWEADCLFFLKTCLKKGRKFDLIVCDPPSVGRSKEGTFQIHKNLSELLELCLKCLEPSGKILLSTNYEAWSLQDLQKQVFTFRSIYRVEVFPTPLTSLDFELPDETPLMKSLIVQRSSAKDTP